MKTQFKEQQTANPLICMIFIRLVLLLWIVFQNLKKYWRCWTTHCLVIYTHPSNTLNKASWNGRNIESEALSKFGSKNIRKTNRSMIHFLRLVIILFASLNFYLSKKLLKRVAEIINTIFSCHFRFPRIYVGVFCCYFNVTWALTIIHLSLIKLLIKEKKNC